MISVYPVDLGCQEEAFAITDLCLCFFCITHSNALHTCAVMSKFYCYDTIDVKIHLITEQTRIAVLISRGTNGCYQAQLDVTNSIFIKIL